MTTTEIIALTSAIAVPVGAVVVKIIDAWVAKNKSKKNGLSQITEAQHSLCEDGAKFRQELRDEIAVLRERQNQLECSLGTVTKEKLKLEEEICNLRVEITNLTNEIVKLRDINASLKHTIATLKGVSLDELDMIIEDSDTSK